MQNIQRHQLDNGPVCLIKEDFSAPLVSIQIWVGAGSAQEGEYLGGGLSHLIEHMIFKGTPQRQPADIAKEIDDAGGSINAYTSLDRTVFWVDMPAEHWPTGLDVLADAVLNASFPENEWRREKDVVRREMAMGNDNPDRVLSKILWQTAYRVHPYRFPVIGLEDTFNTLTRADLIAFFLRNYVPDNMIISIAGSVKADRARAEIEKRFKGVGRRARPCQTQIVEPPQLTPRSARKTGAYNISRLEMAWHTVGLSHPDAPALDILSIIAGGGKSSRLEQKIKENQKLAFSIDAWSFTPKDAGLFGITAAFEPTKEKELIQAIEAEVASWRSGSRDMDSDVAAKNTEKKEGCHSRGGGNPEQKKYLDSHFHGNDRANERQTEINLFTAGEVEKARNKLVAGTLLAFQTIHGQADTFAAGEFYAGSPFYFDAYLKRLAEVTPESLLNVAKKYLIDNNRTTAILSPVVTNITAEALADETTNTALCHPESRPSEGSERRISAISDNTAEIPLPMRLRDRDRNDKQPDSAFGTNIIKTVFPNGLTLICREDHRLPFVHICAASLGGLLLEDERNNGITCLMAELLARGTKTRSQEEIAETIESSGGSISSFSGLSSYGLQAHCFSRDSELFLDILSDCWLNPAFAEDEIAKSKMIQAARIDQQRESPMFLAQEAMRQALFAGHPYRLNVEGTRASVMAITREDLRRLHARTAAGSNMVIAVFGDISAAKAKEVAEKFLGKMPAGQRQDWQKVGRGVSAEPSATSATNRPLAQKGDGERAAHSRWQRDKPEGLPRVPRGSPYQGKKIELTAPREQTIVLAGFPGLALIDKRMDALNILLQALNGLSSDLMISVRDTKGLAYYTGAYHKTGIAGGQFVVYSGTRAAEAERVRTLIEKEISRISSRGIRADEFERARRQIIAEDRRSRQDNGAAAQECALNELYGLGYRYGIETEKRLAQLNPDDVRQAAAEIMQPEKMVEVIIRPEKENAECRMQNEE